MSMTKKQARAFVNDESNWRVKEQSEFIRVIILDQYPIKFVKIQARSANIIDRWNKVPDPRIYWYDVETFGYNPEHNTIEERWSISSMADEVWKMDRENAG